tara:strand:+ start:37 stop:141 length:105 start_codon:yes stop_codon:yes gene_type:complete
MIKSLGIKANNLANFILGLSKMTETLNQLGDLLC